LIVRTNAFESSLTFYVTLEAPINAPFDESKIDQIFNQKDFVFKFEHYLFASLGHQRVHKREGLKDFSPLVGFTLQSFENVLEQLLTVLATERVLCNFSEFRLSGEV
jgi:hypothetical protein